MIRGCLSFRDKSVFSNETKVASEWQVVRVHRASLCWDLGILVMLAEVRASSLSR